MKNTCSCYYCEKHRLITKAYHQKDIETLFSLAKKLGGRAISAEFDNNYYQLILSGDWDGAVFILKTALREAEAKEKSNDTDMGA